MVFSPEVGRKVRWGGGLVLLPVRQVDDDGDEVGEVVLHGVFLKVQWAEVKKAKGAQVTGNGGLPQKPGAGQSQQLHTRSMTAAARAARVTGPV